MIVEVQLQVLLVIVDESDHAWLISGDSNLLVTLLHDDRVGDILREFRDPRLVTDEHETIHPELALG